MRAGGVSFPSSAVEAARGLLPLRCISFALRDRSDFRVCGRDLQRAQHLLQARQRRPPVAPVLEANEDFKPIMFREDATHTIPTLL